MKKLTVLAVYLLGVLSCILYLDYTANKTEAKLYGSRDIKAELKVNVDRANLVLDTVEKKYIKKEVAPQPKPKPEPNVCKCNGTGLILQPDGNRSQCQCAASPEGCKCQPKTEVPQ